MRALWLLLLCSLPVVAGPPSIAVAGGFRMGYSGILKRAGIAFDFLSPTEQCDLAVLQRYELVLCGGAWFEQAKADWSADAKRALDRYVLGGGRLLCEYSAELPDALGEVRDEPFGWRDLTEESGQSFALTPGAHPLKQRLGPGRRWDYGSLLRRFRGGVPAEQVIARFVEGRAAGEPAIIAKRYGEGELVYIAGIISYIQGNWHPLYDDLVLGIVGYLTDGRARPRWAATGPEPEPWPLAPVYREAGLLPDGYEPLGEAGPDGYAVAIETPRALRLALDATAAGHLAVSVEPTRVVVARGEAVLLDRAIVPDTELIVLRTPGELALVSAGRCVGRVGLESAPGGSCGQKGGAVLFQALEPLYVNDDFTRGGPLGAPWRRVSGRWSLTGAGEPYRRVPEFGLRGRRGSVELGDWFWTEYRAELAVRPLGCREIRLRVGVSREHWGELRIGVGRGGSRLVRVAGQRETELGASGASLIDQQWQKLALTMSAGRLRAEVDGEVVLDAAVPELAAGPLGLAVLGGEAMFDDLAVRAPGDLPPAAVHPAGYDKGPDGLLDHDTWSHPAMAWRPDGEVLWHTGRFVGDLDLRLPIARAGGPARLTVHCGDERAPAPALALGDDELADGETLYLRFRGELLEARLGDRTWSLDGLPTSRCIGLEWTGLSLAAGSVVVAAEDVFEQVFHRAADSFWEAEGRWQVGARWPCMPEWAWLTGEGTPRAVWWHKHRLLGDGVVQAYLGVRMKDAFGREQSEPFERLRLTLCGDGDDPRSGYLLELGSAVDGFSRLYRRDRVVATAVAGLPDVKEVHNFWGDLRVERHRDTITAWFMGRLLLEYQDPDPLPDGQLAVWTDENTLAMPYLAVYGRLESARQPLAPARVKARWEQAQWEQVRIGFGAWGLSGALRRMTGIAGPETPPR